MRLSDAEAHALGTTLRRVKPELVKPLAQGQRVWWVGDERYLEASAHLDDDGEVVFFELHVRGRELRLARGVKTGVTGDYRIEDGMPAVRLVTDDGEVDERLLERAIVLLGAAGDALLDRVADRLNEDLALRRGW